MLEVVDVSALHEFKELRAFLVSVTNVSLAEDFVDDWMIKFQLEHIHVPGILKKMHPTEKQEEQRNSVPLKK